MDFVDAWCGINYQLQGCSNLVDGPLVDIVNTVFGLGDWMSVTTTPVEATGFYRLTTE